MLLFYIFAFLGSCILLTISSRWLISGLLRIAKFLGWREFVVAFFIMAFATSVPNLFVGISSALHKIPHLSFGDVVGGNVIDLTLAVALAALVARGLPAQSQTVQITSLFTVALAILPLLLVLDRTISRIDGFVLILGFLLYAAWLFNKKERFAQLYDGTKKTVGFKTFAKDSVSMVVLIILLLLGAEGVTRSASFFAELIKFPISSIGILVVGLGNALPETIFSIQAAKKGESWIILGNLMGSVVVAATLVLGIVAIICPIEITHISPFIVGRVFLLVAALFFLLFLRTDKKITQKEAIFLLFIYILFVVFEILFH